METPEKPPGLRYPWMRDELIAYLLELADPEFQERHWVRREVIDPNRMEGLDFPVHFLLDDTQLFDDPRGAIGVLLYDAAEADAAFRVAAALKAVIDDVGRYESDEPDDVTFLRSHLWPAVVTAAADALRILSERPTAYPPPGVDPYADAARIAYHGPDAPPTDPGA